uniref:T9SS type A sorting domain-containing protein n=1 Tax=Fluviicola sp. TaxID=1917219 RepID=UPI00404A853F
MDTVYILRVGSSELLYKYTLSSTSSHGWPLDYAASKNGYFYGDLGTPIYFTNQSTSTYEQLYNDPEYLYAAHNEMKFTRNTDTLFVAGKIGISKVFNYDVFDTITPNNTLNMPSPNVLEMEWDRDDNLWAVFGDASDDAFAIAKLENDTWTNYFDANNSPIDFSTFNGLEIDTLGNIWVADGSALHTLLTPNSPAWLNVDEVSLDNSFEVYPNPSNGSFTIATKEIQNVSRIEIADLMGRTVHSQVYQPKVAVSLPSGNYFLQLKGDEGLLGVQKIVIE